MDPNRGDQGRSGHERGRRRGGVAGPARWPRRRWHAGHQANSGRRRRWGQRW